MPSDRFVRYAERLLAYSGAVQARARNEMAESGPAQAQIPSTARSDDGKRLDHGVAVGTDGVPDWIRERIGSAPVDVVPGDAASLSFSPAFKGQFSYSKVAAATPNTEDEADGG